MLPENFQERRPVKLHPHLEGKSILIIESPDLFVGMAWRDRLKLERIEESIMYIPRIIQFDLLLKEEEADALVIHSAIKSEWLEAIETVNAKKIPVVCIQGGEVQEGADEAYQRFKELGIPIIRKGRAEFYEELLDALEAQFAAKSR